MTTRRMVIAGLGLVASVALTQPAIGQDTAASEALFNKGVADMEAGKYDTGCPALAESNRLDPRAGTVFALAECEAKWGKVASAVAHYSDYVGMVSRMNAHDRSRHRDRAKTAKSQVEALRPGVPQLTLVLPDGAPKDVVVSRDGAVLKDASLGTALPVDPGEHSIVTQVPGGPEVIQKITIALRENKRIELKIELPKPAAAVTASASSAPASPPPPTSSPPTSQANHTWAYVAGGIGIVGIGVGAVTGLMSMSKKKTVDDNCVGSVCSSPEGKTAADDGKMLGNISTIGFAVGIPSWLPPPTPQPWSACRVGGDLYRWS